MIPHVLNSLLLLLIRQPKIGLALTKRCNKHLNFCLTLPEQTLANDLKKCSYQHKYLAGWENTIYNSQYMCTCLEAIGTVDVGIVRDGTRQGCEFRLPPAVASKPGYFNNPRCQLTWNYNRLHETERLLLTYIDELDTRVRLLVNAVDYFSITQTFSK